jgi:hypothetical protein
MSAFRFDGSITDSGTGVALQGIDVYVVTQPVTSLAIPPTPLASLFSNAAGTTPLVNPVVTDGFGNFFFYAATGTYTLIYYDPQGRMPTQIFPDQQVVTQGGGSLTSVALTMPAEFSVAGSPITTSGTLAVTAVAENANTVYAGPSSGSAAAPAFRTLVTADMPAGVGTVTSVTLAGVFGALFTGSISGTNPITTSGTFTVNIDMAQQAANTFLAGPSSGGTGPVTARTIVAADIAVKTAVTFSATPAFGAGLAALQTFTMTLTGNVTSSTITSPTPGQIITFVITQNATGGWTFAWPANSKGASAIGSNANEVSVQSFVYDGTNWRATSPGSVNAT